MISSLKNKNLVHVAFKDTAIIFAQDQGSFTLELSRSAADLDVSLVLDVYDLDNAAHPEGHLGWWQFPIESDSLAFHGKLQWHDGRAAISLEGVPSSNAWINPQAVAAKRLQFVAVLRENTSNAIVYLEKIPVFQTKADYLACYHVSEVDWQTPRFSRAWFVPDAANVVRIICRNIFMKDAVGNFCLDIYRLCQQNNIPAVLYADNFDIALNKVIKRENRVLFDASADDTILYFHSTHDPLLEDIVSLPAKKKIAYFHGITKPDYLRVFNFELSSVCEKAYQQLPLLAQFDLLAANSKATARVLAGHVKEINANGVAVIAPRLLAKESVANATVAKKSQQRGAKLLYVGRIKSHKKIEDLLILFANYLAHDAEAECWLVGGQGDTAYMDYLHWTIEHHLGKQKNKVKWFGQVSDEELKNLYQTASAYISMSEDEGFCVPLLEAMMAGLPVFAYGIPAVKEVLGEAGVYFVNKDLPVLAQHIHTVLQNGLYVAEMIQKQFSRANHLLANMDGQAILRLFEHSYAN